MKNGDHRREPVDVSNRADEAINCLHIGDCACQGLDSLSCRSHDVLSAFMSVVVVMVMMMMVVVAMSRDSNCAVWG